MLNYDETRSGRCCRYRRRVLVESIGFGGLIHIVYDFNNRRSECQRLRCELDNDLRRERYAAD
jgi:hypothetical protein